MYPCIRRWFALAGTVAMGAGASCPGSAQAQTWHDATEFTLEGKAWKDTEAAYDRLPARAHASVPASVWGLSKHSAGIAVRFETDAPSIQIRWSLTSDALAMPHMPATGVSGVDLYTRVNGIWRFAQNGRPGARDGNVAEAGTGAAPGHFADCMVYLPLYNGTAKAEIGLPTGSTIRPTAARPASQAKPIVFYGTSIVQGGCASRPGLCHTAILGRMLDRPVVNLGFSGSGRMEPALGDLIAEIDAAVYVIDCIWNMGDLNDAAFTERVQTLVRTIRKAHPAAPIVLVGQSNILPAAHPTHLSQVQERAAHALEAEGVRGLYLVGGSHLLGADGEGTVDGCHPNDLGMMRQAEALQAPLRKALKESPPTN